MMQPNIKEVNNNILILTFAFIFVFFMRNSIPPAFVILVGIFYGLAVVVSLGALLVFLFSSLPKFIALARDENNKVQLIFYCCLSQAKYFISVCIGLFFAIHYKISLIFLALVIIDLIVILSVRGKKSYALPIKDYFDKLKVYLQSRKTM